MNTWNNLPNACQIGSIIASEKEHPAAWMAALDEARLEAVDTDWNLAWRSTWDKARNEIWSAATTLTKDQDMSAAWWYAFAALIAWNNSAKYLGMPSDKLKVWMYLSGDPAAVLMLPAVVALEKIKEMEALN